MLFLSTLSLETLSQVVDMEWRFGVTAANDELRGVGSTHLQMRLVLDAGGGKTKTHHMEMSLEQFYDFMREMEKAKSHLDYLQ